MKKINNTKNYKLIMGALLVGALTLKSSKVGMSSVPTKDRKVYNKEAIFGNRNPKTDVQLHLEEIAKEQPNPFVKIAKKVQIAVGKKRVEYFYPDKSKRIRSGGTLPWRNMNPGALRYGSFAKKYGAIGVAGKFAVFPSENAGMEALKALLKTESYRDLTVAKAVEKYAPPHENNTKSYQRNLSHMTGVSLSKKLGQLTQAELDVVADVIKFIEGWVPGNEEVLEAPNTKPDLKMSALDMLKQRASSQKSL